MENICHENKTELFIVQHNLNNKFQPTDMWDFLSENIYHSEVHAVQFLSPSPPKYFPSKLCPVFSRELSSITPISHWNWQKSCNNYIQHDQHGNVFLHAKVQILMSRYFEFKLDLIISAFLVDQSRKRVDLDHFSCIYFHEVKSWQNS